MANFEQNTELYERMKIPYKNHTECSKGTEGFLTELKTLREKHKIENVLVWIHGDVLIDGKTKEYVKGMFYGNMEREEFIADYAHKQAYKNSFIREISNK